MGLPLLLAPAAIQGVGALASYFSRKKNRTPKFEDTEQGRFLQQISQQGRYSPTAIANILSRTARQTGNLAQIQRSRTRGQLQGQFGSSIAGTRALSEPGIAQQRQLGEATRGLQTENELSKVSAREQLAQGVTQFGERRRQEKRGARQELIQGLAGATSQGISGYSGYQQDQEFNAGIDAYAKARAKQTPEGDAEAMAIILRLLGTGG